MIRTGVLGCASIADRMVIPAILQSDDLQLVAVASRSAEKGKVYAQKFNCEAITGYEKLLQREDIDAVYIPLPTGLHHEWAIKALNSGKHVLLEKSLATNYREAEEIIQLAQEKNLLVKENFMFEYHRQFQFIQSILAEKKLGELRCIRSSFGFPPFKDADNIRYQPDLGGGALLDAGAYTIKVASILTNYIPSVYGARLTIDSGKGVDVHGGIFMGYDNGCVIETAFGFDHFYQCNLEIWGNEGKLVADRIFTAGPGVQPKITLETTKGKEEFAIEPDNHFVNLLNHFAHQIMHRDFADSHKSILQQAELIQKVKDIAVRVKR